MQVATGDSRILLEKYLGKNTNPKDLGNNFRSKIVIEGKRRRPRI
jgi:hypothetical protein